MKYINFLNRILPSVFWVTLILGFNSPKAALLTLISAAIHECGHYCFGILINKRNGLLPKGVLYGLRISISSNVSYKDELILALGGPCFNILASALLSHFNNEFLKLFKLINLLTALSNLIPIENNDGHRIIKSTLYIMIRDSVFAENISYWIAFLTSSVLTFISLFTILFFGEGYWAFFIFFSSLLISIIQREKF